ncbi:MAG TPA: hypothetical protein VLT84_07335 [Acidobacteriota bacterium]|nr:hypothetical protein [Acidobacteriota bacterium]
MDNPEIRIVYLLWMFQRVMFGPVTNEKNRGLPDLTRREFWVLAPLLVFIVWIGVYPNTFLRFLDVPASELMERVSSRTIAARTTTPEWYGGGDAEGAGALDAAGTETSPVPTAEGLPQGLPMAPPDSAEVEVVAPEPPVGSPGRVTP